MLIELESDTVNLKVLSADTMGCTTQTWRQVICVESQQCMEADAAFLWVQDDVRWQTKDTCWAEPERQEGSAIGPQ